MDSESLICKHYDCNKYFKEPIILPCGSSMCKEHLENLQINENKKKRKNLKSNFKCSSCKKNHDLFKEYETNISLLDLIAKHDLLVSEPHRIDLKESLEEIQDSLNKFNLLQNDPNNYIYESIGEQKRLVDLQREKLKLQIDEISDNLIQKLDEIKNKSLEKMKTIKKIDIDEKKLKTEKMLQDVIRNPNLDDIFDDIDHLKQETARDIWSLERFLRNETIYEFKPNNKKLQQTDFGCFIYKPDAVFNMINEIKTNQELIESVVYYPDNKLITGSSQGCVQIWDLISYKCLHKIELKYKIYIDKLLFDSKKNRLFCLSREHQHAVDVFCLSTYNQISHLEDFYKIFDICLTNDGNLITSDFQYGVQIWNENAKYGVSHIPEYCYQKMIVSKDEKLIGNISTEDEESVIIVISLENGRELFRLPGSSSPLNFIQILSNSRTLLTIHDDGIRIWDLSEKILTRFIDSNSELIARYILMNDENYILLETFDDDESIFLCDIHNDIELNNPIHKDEDESFGKILLALPNDNIVTAYRKFLWIYENFNQK